MNRQLGQRPLPRYSFILSVWQEGGTQPNASPVWRYSLEDVGMAGRRGFKSLAELAAFLGERTTERPVAESNVTPHSPIHP